MVPVCGLFVVLYRLKADSNVRLEPPFSLEKALSYMPNMSETDSEAFSIVVDQELQVSGQVNDQEKAEKQTGKTHHRRRHLHVYKHSNKTWNRHHLKLDKKIQPPFLPTRCRHLHA